MVKRVLTAVLKCYMGYNTEFSDNINSSIREIHSLIARNRIKKYKKVVIMVQWPRKGNDEKWTTKNECAEFKKSKCEVREVKLKFPGGESMEFNDGGRRIDKTGLKSRTYGA